MVERRDRTPRETEVTFVLTYRDLGEEGKLKPEEAPQVSTENTVAVVKEKGAWAIRAVLGKSTTIDFPVQQGAIVKPPAPGETLPPETFDDEGEDTETENEEG